MFNKLLKLSFGALFIILGAVFVLPTLSFIDSITKYYLSIIILALISLVLSYPASELCERFLKKLSVRITSIPTRELTVGVIGALICALLGFLIMSSISASLVGGGAAMLVTAMLSTVGFRVGIKKSADFSFIRGKATEIREGKPKILDTSVIIDGRILDILKTGFIEGKIIIPTFILEELRHIADSSDALKRNRGRLGLDVLNQIKTIEGVCVEITEWMPPQSGTEVDIMLLKLAQEIGGCVITNDLNLNKVAELHKVPVLNINFLSNAVKSIVLPGQEMTVFIVKEGKEQNQGVAYLNDGTMIVIEDGKKFIDNNIEIIVTSVLQTPAGRMVFGKYKENQAAVGHA